MASLPTKSFNQIVSDTIAGIQGRANKLLNFSIGSVLRAIVEGFGGLFLWFQAMALQVLQATRLSTSSGIDVDTFTADFMPIIAGSQTSVLPSGSPRLGAQAATGIVTFSRLTAAPSTCFIPVGATAMTVDQTQTFTVTADPSNPNFVGAPAQGYLLQSSVASIDVPVAANVPGIGGNVLANTITVMTSPVIGIDAVNNAAAFINGIDQESDSALKQRFSAYILGLSRGDFYGLNASIEGTAVNVQWTLTEGYNFDGSYHPGYFFVVADDGSGVPPPSFLAAVTTAANAVRPLGVQCAVFPPTVIFADVSMTLTTASGYDHDTVVAQVVAAITDNINALGLGNSLPWSILAGWAYAIPGVTEVRDVQLNGITGDAATIITYKLTNDRTFQIQYATVKSGIMTIS